MNLKTSEKEILHVNHTKNYPRHALKYTLLNIFYKNRLKTTRIRDNLAAVRSGIYAGRHIAQTRGGTP